MIFLVSRRSRLPVRQATSAHPAPMNEFIGWYAKCVQTHWGHAHTVPPTCFSRFWCTRRRIHSAAQQTTAGRRQQRRCNDIHRLVAMRNAE